MLFATLFLAMCLRFCRTEKSDESVEAPNIVAAHIQSGEFGLPRNEIKNSL